MKGLIGYSGFVGSNINLQFNFNEFYNSINISKIKNKNFDLLICAGAPGSMLHANADTESDKNSINILIENLKNVRSKKFILISSIAVYENMGLCQNEDSRSFEIKNEYGKNRKYLEDACAEIFENLIILRLPALFGNSLKKNFIYDILNPIPSYFTFNKYEELQSLLSKRDFVSLNRFYKSSHILNMMELNRDKFNVSDKKKYFEETINDLNVSSISLHSKQSTFQFYNLLNFKEDLKIIMKNNIALINLVNEPISTGELYKFIKNKEMPNSNAHIHKENIESKFSFYWNEKLNYMFSKAKVKEDIKHVLRNYIE
jgi:hypothetical protein